MAQPSTSISSVAKELLFTAAVTLVGKSLFPKAPILNIAACSVLCQQGFSLIEKAVGGFFTAVRKNTETLAPSQRLEKTTSQLTYCTAGMGTAWLFLGVPGSPVQLAVFPLAFLIENYAKQYFSYPSRTLRSMTLKDKIGQLLMVHFNGEVPNEQARELVQQVKVGGVIFYNWSNGDLSPQQARALSGGLQEMARQTPHKIPLTITADQEGGLVTRLPKGYTVLPGNRALGETRNPDLARQAAFITGKEMRAVGLNMNLAPVADTTKRENPVIGIRSFGEDPEVVSVFTEKTIEGYHEAEEATTTKHWPDHGDVTVDSHDDLPVIPTPLQQLRRSGQMPFTRTAHLTDAIMPGHLLVQALDPDHCTTLSEKSLTYLRDKIGFNRVIISDSLVMGGVLKQTGTVDEAAKRALNAGCNILLLGGKQLIDGNSMELGVLDVQRIHRFLVEAVEKGEVPIKKVNDSVYKILTLKERYCFSKGPSTGQLEDVIRAPKHLALAKSIAEGAIKIQGDRYFTPEVCKRIALFAPEILRAPFEGTDLWQNRENVSAHFYKTLSPSAEDIETTEKMVQDVDALILCSYNAWKNPSQAAQSLFELGKPVIVIMTRDPYDASLFPKADLIVTTHSPTTPSLQAALDRLK
jgi:beta-N-acetylhexosaminidase